MSDTIATCEDYLAWGVPYCWILDPENERAWEFTKGQRLHEIPAGGTLAAGEIVLPVDDIFSLIQN